MQVDLDVTLDDSPQCPDEFVDLPRVRAADGVRYADTVDTNLVYRLVDGQEVHEVGPERVLGREPDLNRPAVAPTMGLDKVDDLDRSLGDVCHVLAVRELAKEGRGADDNVNAVDAGFDGDARIVHVAADVGEDLRVEAELADGFAVRTGLLGRGGRGELEVLDTERIERPCDRDLRLRIEESVGELFALCSSRIDVSEVKGRSQARDDRPRRVLSMILKFEMLLRKSDARGAYGFTLGCECVRPSAVTPFGRVGADPLTPLTLVEPDMSMATISSDEDPAVACGHILEVREGKQTKFFLVCRRSALRLYIGSTRQNHGDSAPKPLHPYAVNDR